MNQRRTKRGSSWRAPLIFLVIVGLIVGALVWLGPTIANNVRVSEGRLYVGAECSVETQDGTLDLSRDQAKLATTAVALASRGAETPDTSGIDPAVIQRLADGPADDAGPSLRCEAPPLMTYPSKN